MLFYSKRPKGVALVEAMEIADAIVGAKYTSGLIGSGVGAIRAEDFRSGSSILFNHLWNHL
jgi:hypothetical protein